YPRASSMTMLPVVTPLAMEVGAGLVPLVEGEKGSAVDRAAEIRDRIVRSTGVRVPGVRFRGNDSDLPPDTYLLMLDEVPLVMGSIPEDAGEEDRAAALFGHLERFIRQHLA